MTAMMQMGALALGHGGVAEAGCAVHALHWVWECTL